MFAIYKKELKSYFNSVMACLFIAVTLALTGLYFTAYTLFSGYASISYAIQSSMFLLLISVPVLTMKVMAEERRQKSDQLLITAPLSVGKIVAGKYFAMLTIFAIPCVVICFYPLFMCLFGEIPLVECYLAIFGYFLFGAACIAIGVFISSVTETQVIAAVLGFLALFLGYMMPSICSLISTDGNLLTKILSSYDLYTEVQNYYSDLFDITGLVYYVTIAILFLFLTCQSVQKRRWNMSKKNFSTGVFNSAFVVVAIVVTIVVNMIVSALPEDYTVYDMSSSKIYSITDDTKDMLKELEDDITIYVLAAESGADTMLGKTLSKYEAESSHVTVEYKDTTKYPTFYMEYTSDSSISANSLIIVNETTGTSQIVDYSDIYEYELDYTTYSYNVTGYDAEGQITSAIAYVSSGDLPKIYVLSGHGESDLDESVTELITKGNISYSSINLMDYDDVPDDADLVVINAPTSDFNEDDAQKVIDYLAGGGKAIIVTTYTTEDMTNFYTILEEYGMSIADGMLVEGNSSYYYQSPVYLLPEIVSNTMTSSVYGQYYIFAPYAQGIITEEQDEDSELSLTSLLLTSDDVYSKTNMESDTIEKEDGDIDGPFSIAVYAEKTTTDEETSEEITTQLVVVSCSYLFTADADSMVSGANMLLFNGILNEMVDVEMTTSIASKSYTEPTVTVDYSNTVLIGTMVTIIVPVIILAVGVAVWIRRRRK